MIDMSNLVGVLSNGEKHYIVINGQFHGPYSKKDLNELQIGFNRIRKEQEG